MNQGGWSDRVRGVGGVGGREGGSRVFGNGMGGGGDGGLGRGEEGMMEKEGAGFFVAVCFIWTGFA